jgi:hypothetical protein
MPITRCMTPAWRDVNRNHREHRPEQTGADKRTPKRQPARAGLNVPMPVFLKLFRQSPPKS